MSTYRINQIEMVSAIMNHLGAQGVTDVSSRQVNACIAAANSVCDAMLTEDRHATPGCGYAEWAASDDVGRSSRYLANMLQGRVSVEVATPLDAGDWRRCCHMLACCPELRAELPEARDTLAYGHPVWAWLVRHWEYAEWLLAVDPARMTAELERVWLSKNRQEVRP